MVSFHKHYIDYKRVADNIVMEIYLSIKMLPPPSPFCLRMFSISLLRLKWIPNSQEKKVSKDNHRNNKTSKLVQALYDKAIAGIVFCIKKRLIGEEVMPASHQP